uniref:Uncharacterized protein n=1 Tax=Oryzias sinensis TaxID=183150 RepID=A0A8C7YD00_9TELE
MAATGVLPFIRGVDLSGNDFKVRFLKTTLPDRPDSKGVLEHGWRKNLL